MNAIVLVHGVNQQQKGAATIHEEIIHALSDGIRNAAKYVRDAELQSRANALAERISALDVKVSTPFYGDLFLKPRVEGPAAQEFGDSLARAWIQAASERAARDRTREVAEQELRQLTAQGEAQGVGRMAGSAFESLGRIPGLAQTLMGVATAIKPTFSQLNLYLSDPALQQTIREEVSRQISPATRVVIGHSLGSIVTYDVVRTLNRPLPLFLTLGPPWACRRSSTSDCSRSHHPSPLPSSAGSILRTEKISWQARRICARCSRKACQQVHGLTMTRP